MRTVFVYGLHDTNRYVFANKAEPQRVMVRKIGAMHLPHAVAQVVAAVFNVAGE